MFGYTKWMKRPANRARTAMVMIMSLCLALSGFTPAFASAEVQSQTKMKHSPPRYFVSDHRIQLDAEVTDPSGVELVRCYFRGTSEADFVFVPMTATGGNKYSGILPAPSGTTEQIEYLFLSVNAENQIVKSQTFVIDREERERTPAWQEIAMEGDIQVSMELDQVPAELAGFSDNIAMNAVESGARFGVAAGGIYYLTAGKTASTSGAAAAATSTGAITAGAAGISTLALVGGGVLGAAAIGAAAGGGGGGGGGGPAPTPDPEPVENWSSWYTPSQPTAGTDVTVWVDVGRSGVAVDYDWWGTDGWSGQGTETSDASGRISFVIDGADAGVTDTVTVSVPAWGPEYTRTWTYTFIP